MAGMSARMTYAETFARAHAKQRVEEMAVTVDKGTGVILVTFHGRSAQISFSDVALQEEAFERLAVAVDKVLGIESGRARGEVEEITGVDVALQGAP